MPGARDGTGQQEGLPEEAGLRASAFKSALWLSRRPSAQHNAHSDTHISLSFLGKRPRQLSTQSTAQLC